MAVDFIRPEHSINMERGDGIIRWSPNRSRDEFLTINLTYRTLDLHKAIGKIQSGGTDDDFQHEVISKHTDFQSFSAYDWSPIAPRQDMTPLLAVGSKTGDVHLLRIDDDSSDSISLPLKIPRSCHAVAFNTTGLLAVGLDRVRNDHCLQIWDINQRLSGWDPTKKGFQNLHASAEPYMRLEPSVPISSTRWFEDQPMTLVAGVKGQSLRMHDLRGQCILTLALLQILTLNRPKWSSTKFPNKMHQQPRHQPQRPQLLRLLIPRYTRRNDMGSSSIIPQHFKSHLHQCCGLK